MTATRSGSRADDIPHATIEAARGGDQSAFAIVVHRWAMPLAAYLQLAADDASTREELLRDAFMQAWQRIPDLKLAEQLDVWLLRIAQAAATRQLRATASRGRAPGLWADAAELLALRPLLELPRPHREVLTLRYLFGTPAARLPMMLGVASRQVGEWERDGLAALAVDLGTARAA